jgi:DNA-binding PadR family transcriptional regulator
VSPVFAHGQLRLYLLALLDDGPRHGYEVIRALEERFGGLYAPSAGSVYPRLSRLEEEGLVSRSDEGRTAVYRITEAGRAEVRERADHVTALQHDLDASVRRLAADVRARVRADARDLRSELRQAAREARRTAVGVGEARAGAHPERPAPADVEEALRAFGSEVRAQLHRHGADAARLAEVRAVLDDAARRVGELLSRGA